MTCYTSVQALHCSTVAADQMIMLMSCVVSIACYCKQLRFTVIKDVNF